MEHQWVHSEVCMPIPPSAIIGGHDCDGSPIYVGRSFHEGDNLPAKIIPNKNEAYISWGGYEITKSHYEVLTGDYEYFKWIPCAEGSVPPNAVLAGNTVTGELLYIGRAHWEGSLTVGKVQPSHNCMYIPFGGVEQRLSTYEVLTSVQPHVWVPASLNNIPPGAVVAGHDTDGSTIYVGRANHEGVFHPAKIVPHNGGAYISYAGNDIYKDNFEILTGEGYSWVKADDESSFPQGAVATGHNHDGALMFVGRGQYRKSLTPGKVFQGYNRLFIAYGGKEVKLHTYEILVKN